MSAAVDDVSRLAADELQLHRIQAGTLVDNLACSRESAHRYRESNRRLENLVTYAATPHVPAPGTTPLSQPLYGASFGQAFARFWRKYVTFSGRASRSEFWWFFLAHALIVTAIFVFMLIGAFAGATTDPLTGRSEPGPLLGVDALLLVLWQLATLVPMISLSWRRLHDANLAGPFWFLGLVFGIGGIAVLVLCALPSNPAGARFDK